MLYYQIMNGITGTAMPYFKRELESEKIWDVSNYVAEQFMGVVDANSAPRGIDAAFEPVYEPLDKKSELPGKKSVKQPRGDARKMFPAETGKAASERSAGGKGGE